MRRARAILSTLSLALTASAANAQEEPGYPIEEFLSVTSISEIAVSPDGRYVALISRKDDFQRNEPESTIWRIDLDERGRPTATVRLAASAPSYSQLGWSADSRYLAFLSGGASGESNHVYVLDMRGGEALRLTDPEQFSDGVATYDWMPDGTAIVFAAPLPQTPEEKEAYETLYGDVMRFADEPHAMTIERIPVSLKDTEATRLARVSIWVQSLKVAPGGRLAALLSTAPTKPQRFYNGLSQTEIFLLPLQGDGSLRRLTSNFISEGTIQWRRDGDGLYVNGLGYLNETRGRWTQGRIFAVTLDGAMRRVASDFTGSWAQAQQMPDGTLLGGAVLSTRANLYRIDPRSERPEPLTDYRGAVSDLSVSRDGSIIAFALVTDRSAPEVYVARGVRNIGKAERVTDLNADFNAMPRPEIEAIRWPNGEGDEIEGILFWPPGRRGERGLPLVVDIHGGPWSVRTENLGPFSFAYYPALLASRGFLVLEPNYRGGTGRGDEFLHAIEGYSCSRPATDILSGVDYLIEQGWADPDRMGVMGYSYGGLMTNCLITRTDRFRAAASGAGLWNDISYFGTADNFVQNDVRNLGQAPWEDLENYWEESPISGAANITTPTLIVIGGADRRVPTTQGYELYRALVRLGVPAELLVFPREPHRFREPAHKLAKVRAEIRWLDRYVLGKSAEVFD
jgi:dipeptidyl aminopeptidase/acylaminoacyl peptidase